MVLYPILLSQSWSTAVPNCMLVSGIAQSGQNLALSRLANSHILLISIFICSFFFLSNENYCQRFLGSYWSHHFKFCARLQVGKIVTKSHILLIRPFICSFFFLFNEKFCHRFLDSTWSQCFHIFVYTFRWKSVLCK